MPGMDPKKVQQMMKQLNMNIEEIPAERVIIETKTKKLVIQNPEVMVTKMMGKDVYQVTGSVSEQFATSEDDIRLVMEQTGKDRETVAKKLEELSNDLARAIIELKEEEKRK